MSLNIYVEIKGGLGNQLFQFNAFLIIKNFFNQNINLYCNFQNDTYGRSFLIDKVLSYKFNLCDSIPVDCIRVKSEDLTRIIEYLGTQTHGNFLIDGYFQNYDYLLQTNIHEYLLDIRPKKEITAVHLRRSDYGHHGLLPSSYYFKCLEILGHSKFVVYSDEYNYSSYIFGNAEGFSGVVKSNLENPLEDFFNIASCSVIIMANSSFSYFASYFAYRIYLARVLMPSEWSLIAPYYTGIGSPNSWEKMNINLIAP